MDPSESLKNLRKLAESLPVTPSLQIRPRKSLPGTSIFSAHEHLLQPHSASSMTLRRPISEQATPIPPLDLRFRPPITPSSLSRPQTQRHPDNFWTANSSYFTSPVVHDDAPMLDIELPVSSEPSAARLSENLYHNLPRRTRTVDTHTKIDQLLETLRHDRISPIDVLNQVLDPQGGTYDRYRSSLYREDSNKLSVLLENIIADERGKSKLFECLAPHLCKFVCDIVADEMENRRKQSYLKGVSDVTPAFMADWSLDEAEDCTPMLSSILAAASQTDRAKERNKKKKPEKLYQVVTQQLLYQFSNRCLAFQTAFGLFLWSTGGARQAIDAVFRCGLSVGYDSVQSHIASSAQFCMDATANIVKSAHSFCYDNLNVSRSIFYEQVGGRVAGKVTSGTFGIFYGLRNAKREHMLIAPMMKRFRTLSGLQFNRDIRPSLDHLTSVQDQLMIVTIRCLSSYEPEFHWIVKHPALQHKPRRPIPVGYRTQQYPLRASTIEEATVLGNLQFHDEIYIHQLKQTPESLSKYAIPGFHDQLTNARIRSAQLMRSQDVNAWERREVFQLGFGLFHMCLNLVWAILHTHRGNVNHSGSLAYFFAVTEKARLANDQPDYHSLLAALTQVLDGILLNAWLRECGFATLEAFAKSNPAPEHLRTIATRILEKYATPMSAGMPEPESPSHDDSTDSESESTPAISNSSRPVLDPKDDIAHQNIRLLMRDILMVTLLVRAISDGDFGRVEVLLGHLTMLFRGAGCNKYSTEILHFLQNVKYVWTPEFADIMRDNSIICLNGRGPGHCMAVDLNIEHLIGYLKNLLRVKGMDSTWDRLGNTSAAIVHIQAVKKKIAAILGSTYQSTSHTTPDTSHLVWRVQAKIADEELHQFQPGRARNTQRQSVVDILSVGEAKLKSSTLATFNKKTAAMIAGQGFEDEEDECPAMALTGQLPEDFS